MTYGDWYYWAISMRLPNPMYIHTIR
jgi:hypothetical protein